MCFFWVNINDLLNFVNEKIRIKDAKRRNVAAIDRLLVDKPQYIKNAEVRDKYMTRNAAKIAAQV